MKEDSVYSFNVKASLLIPTKSVIQVTQGDDGSLVITPIKEDGLKLIPKYSDGELEKLK